MGTARASLCCCMTRAPSEHVVEGSFCARGVGGGGDEDAHQAVGLRPASHAQGLASRLGRVTCASTFVRGVAPVAPYRDGTRVRGSIKPIPSKVIERCVGNRPPGPASRFPRSSSWPPTPASQPAAPQPVSNPWKHCHVPRGSWDEGRASAGVECFAGISISLPVPRLRGGRAAFSVKRFIQRNFPCTATKTNSRAR